MFPFTGWRLPCCFYWYFKLLSPLSISLYLSFFFFPSLSVYIWTENKYNNSSTCAVRPTEGLHQRGWHGRDCQLLTLKRKLRQMQCRGKGMQGPHKPRLLQQLQDPRALWDWAAGLLGERRSTRLPNNQIWNLCLETQFSGDQRVS